MAGCPKKPIRIVGHWTFYVDRHNPLFNEVRAVMGDFAAIKIRTPSLYAYRQDGGYCWNAFSRDVTAKSIVERLKPLSKTAVPSVLHKELETEYQRYLSRIATGPATERISFAGRDFSEAEFFREKWTSAIHRTPVLDNRVFSIPTVSLCSGDEKMIKTLRDYQRQAIELATSKNALSGVLSLPCGSGKTMIGIGIIRTVEEPVAVFVPSRISAEQWIAEAQKWSSLPPFALEVERGWWRVTDPLSGKWWIVGPWTAIPESIQKLLTTIRVALYDEVHALPQGIFSNENVFHANLRIGLTGSLAREDSGLLFIHNLIGPIRYCVSCEEMYQQGFISVPQCIELKVPFQSRETKHASIKEASANPAKIDVLERLLKRHVSDAVLVFAAYNEQLYELSRRFRIPCLSGTTTNAEKSRVIKQFNEGSLNVLGLSKSGSSSIDFPRATIGIQLSGSFSSRSEEMQRIGRIMRVHPADSKCVFYTLVSEGTAEEELSANRQMYLMEHGIPYLQGDSDEFL